MHDKRTIPWNLCRKQPEWSVTASSLGPLCHLRTDWRRPATLLRPAACDDPLLGIFPMPTTSHPSTTSPSAHPCWPLGLPSIVTWPCQALSKVWLLGGLRLLPHSTPPDSSSPRPGCCRSGPLQEPLVSLPPSLYYWSPHMSSPNSVMPSLN